MQKFSLNLQKFLDFTKSSSLGITFCSRMRKEKCSHSTNILSFLLFTGKKPRLQCQKSLLGKLTSRYIKKTGLHKMLCLKEISLKGNF